MKNSGIYIVCFLVFVTITFVMLPDIIVKSKIEAYGKAILGTEVDIESVNLSFFSSKLTIKGLTVKNPKKYKLPQAISIAEIVVDLRPLSLLGDTIEIQSLHVSAPIITVETSMAGNNFNDMRKVFFKKNTPTPSQTETTPHSGKFVIIDKLRIDQAQIFITAGFVDQKGKKASILVPTIEMENLGKENNYLTFKQLLNKIILESAKDMDGINQTMIKGLIEDLNHSIKEVSEQFKNLF